MKPSNWFFQLAIYLQLGLDFFLRQGFPVQCRLTLGSLYNRDCLELAGILLSQAPECSDYRCVPPCPALISFYNYFLSNITNSFISKVKFRDGLTSLLYYWESVFWKSLSWKRTKSHMQITTLHIFLYSSSRKFTK